MSWITRAFNLSRAAFDGIGQDLRYASRLLPRNPGFAAVAIVSLALGIGANAAVFSLLNAVAWRSIDARRPDQLVSVTPLQRSGTSGYFSYPMFEAFAREQRVFSSLVGEWGGAVLNVDANGVRHTGAVWAVTGNFHSALGAIPYAGRLLTDADVNLDARQPQMVAVIGHGLWQRGFGGDPSVIGRNVKVDDVPFTIVGIGPKGFTAFGTYVEPDVTIPLTSLPSVRRDTVSRFNNPKAMWLDVVGRLRDDVSLDEARSRLMALWPSVLASTAPSDYTVYQRDEFMGTKLNVASAARGRDSAMRGRLTRSLSVVLAAAGLILLIACVNLASLMISRAASRSHEISIRMALGAGRWRLARQMIIEGLLLSGIAACVGLLFASWTSAALKEMMTRDYNVPTILDVSPDGRVLAFTSAVALIAGILFTLVPAWRATGRNPAASPLLQSARTVTGSTRTGKVLIVAEVALSVMLLMAAVLLVRTLQHLQAIDVGFTRSQVTIVSRLPTPEGDRAFDGDRYYPALLERLGAVPGVDDVAVAKLRPGEGFRSIQRLRQVGADADVPVVANTGQVGPGVFRILEMPFVAGRDVTWNDNARAPRVAILSRSLAERMFPGGNPIGGRVRLDADSLRGEPGGDAEVIGVVRDVRLYDPRDPSPFAIYVSILQDRIQGRHGDVLIRRGAAPLSESDVRRAIHSLGLETVLRYRTLHQLHERAILQERMTGLLAGFFGALALTLSAIGLYGLMAYAVTQRTRELAIRRVLGAQSHEVVRMVVRETLGLVLLGILIGLPLTLISGRVVSGLLFGVTSRDPIAVVAIAAMLIGVGLLAGYLPGRRAVRVQPMDALRS